MFGLMNENPSFPSISVVIPTLDRRYTLPRTLDSVLNQTLPPDEIIVVDNGSTDGTSSMLKTNYPDVICLQEVKRGVSAARNKGILCANGVWIALLDSDDTWHPSKLEEQLKANRNKPGHRLIHTDEQWYKRGKRVNQLMKHKKRGGYIFKDCLKLCCISPSSALIEKSLFQNIGQFDEDLPVCEDYDLWLRVSAQEPILYVDQPLTIKYGGHEDQLSKKYWGMDRFRIKSLEKILLEGHLNQVYKMAAQKILISKLKVLINGAIKRNNQAVIEEYSGKLENWEKTINQNNRFQG